MVAKYLASTAISAAAMMALVGHVAARPMAIPEPVYPRATGDADQVVLDPSTNMGGIGSTPNDDLLDWDTFYWSNGDIVAKMTCTAGKNNKMLNVARMGSDVTDLDCADPGNLIMSFKDKSALDSAKSDWQWINGEKNTMIVVADGGNCGGSLGRGEYAITDVQYNDKSLQAKLIGRSTTWADFVDDYKLNVKSGGANTNTGNFTRRIGKSGSIDLANDFSKNIFSKDIGPVNLSVDCAHCATTGSIDFDFDFSITDGVTGSITARNGLGASLGVGLTASGELTDGVDLGSTQLLTLPLAGISVPPFLNIGPQITAGVTSNLQPVTAAITADFGVAMVIPDGTTLRLGGDSDPINPQFNKIGPTLSASVSVGASLSPVVTFDFAATVFGVGVVAGVGLEAPKLDATLTVQATTDAGVCGDADANAGVELDVNVGVNVNLFAGFGSATDQPNSNSIFSTSTPVFNDCVVIA